MSKDTLVPMLKEMGRLLVFALPGALILFFTENPDVAGMYGLPILFVLRSIDKGLHESQEVEVKGVEVKGLVPF